MVLSTSIFFNLFSEKMILGFLFIKVAFYSCIIVKMKFTRFHYWIVLKSDLSIFMKIVESVHHILKKSLWFLFLNFLFKGKIDEFYFFSSPKMLNDVSHPRDGTLLRKKQEQWARERGSFLLKTSLIIMILLLCRSKTLSLEIILWNF